MEEDNKNVIRQQTRFYDPVSVEELRQKGTASAARQAARLNYGVIKRAKVPNSATKKTMQDDGKLRGAGIKALANFSKNPANYAMSSAQASKNWEDYVRKNNAQHAFGMDAIGIKNREKAKAAGFKLTKGSGKFTPFIVANGILRGGETSHMEEEGNGRASIPIELADHRKLVSCRGKYSNPSMFPASRVVKFMRGNWGLARKINSYERL